MKHPLSDCVAPSLATREGAYGQPATPSLQGGLCSASLRWAMLFPCPVSWTESRRFL